MVAKLVHLPVYLSALFIYYCLTKYPVDESDAEMGGPSHVRHDTAGGRQRAGVVLVAAEALLWWLWSCREAREERKKRERGGVFEEPPASPTLSLSLFA
jgi:hypothetical protein